MNKYVGTTQRQISNTAATKRHLTRHCEDAHTMLAKSALWNDESALATAKAYMSYLFLGNPEDAARSAQLDPSTKEFVKLIFARHCRYSEARLFDQVGAYGQQLGWYETISTNERHVLEVALGEAVAEKARQLIFWGGLDPFKKRVVELIIKAYPTVEYSWDSAPTELAFGEAKKGLTEEDLARTKPLRIALNVARAKLQDAHFLVRVAAARTQPPANS